MSTPVEQLDQLNHQIKFLETLQQLNDVLSEIRERIDGAKDIESWLQEEGTATMINNLKGLLLALQGEMVAIPKFITKLDAGISAAGQITAGVDAITRMVKAIETAQTSTGEQKAKDFAELFSDWTTLLGAIGYILEGFSVNPVIGVYFMLLGKAISAIAVSLGRIEAATQATNAAIRVARGFDPAVDTSAEEATAEQRRQLQALIDNLKKERDALIDEFGLEARAQVDAAIGAALTENGLTMVEMDELRTALSTARGALSEAWQHLQELIARKGAILATGGSAHEVEAIEEQIKQAERALADAFDAYERALKPVKRFDDAVRRRLEGLKASGEAVFEDWWLDGHIPWLTQPGYENFPEQSAIRQYLRSHGLLRARRWAILSRLGLTGLMGLLPSGRCYAAAIALAALGILSICGVGIYLIVRGGFLGLLGAPREIALQPEATAGLTEVVEGQPKPSPTAAPTMPPREAFALIDDFVSWYGLSDEAWWELHGAYFQDPSGGLLYSIMNVVAGLTEMQVNIDRWFAQPMDFSQVVLDTKLNFTDFPCNEQVDGVLTVCESTAGDIEEGELLVFGMEFGEEIPLADPGLFYVYSVVLDTDGDPVNNFQFVPPYDWDFYQNTDTWYQLMWSPFDGAWTLSLTDFRQGEPIALHTDARAMLSGNLIYFLIPGDELEATRPSYRMTSFAHDGTYAPQASGGDVTGNDPTEPLMQMPENAIIVD
jgi:hypothetical protein